MLGRCRILFGFGSAAYIFAVSKSLAGGPEGAGNLDYGCKGRFPNSKPVVVNSTKRHPAQVRQFGFTQAGALAECPQPFSESHSLFSS
jgi:hypothetical protein